MPNALSLLAKAEKKHTVERRLGKKLGDASARTVIGGRSYDHVNTKVDGEREIHPTNVHQKLGNVTTTPARTYAARHKEHDLGEHTDKHQAARAVVSHARGLKGFGVFGLSDNDNEADDGPGPDTDEGLG